MACTQVDASSNEDSTRQDPAGPSTARGPNGLVSGTVLAGKYRLELQLGAGGMAVVWSAYHLELETPVAIKLLRGHDPSLAQRMKLEARASARLAHPAIVRVLDVAETDEGDPFIVMDLLSGETLASALGRGNVSALRAVQLLLPIADALAFAHEHGVVHRDLKPENVFLAVEGDVLQPKLLDFGIAKLTEASAAIRLTASGTTLGSPSYMSPEQARGDEVDHRSDVWSFCVLLYKAIGRRPPFRGATPQETIDAILKREPPPLPLGAGVDGHLARIVLSGLNKDAAARPASMRQLGQQLARWLLLHGVPVDACGTPLVAKWLSGEPSTRPRASDAPPPREPRSPPQRPVAAAERAQVALLAAPASPASQSSPSSARRRRLPPLQSRRWVLWALAGVLSAGVCLGLTRTKDSPRRSAAQPLRSEATVDLLLAAGDADVGARKARPSEPLAADDTDANEPAPVADGALKSTSMPRPAGATRHPAPPRAKSSAPASRSALPF
ncbi:MAG TPA: serine/threonine-protein kinase [Polyangiaceae bacterium]|nr:serine/threonine-protein kinase [Polyangiaceae bacterium]